MSVETRSVTSPFLLYTADYIGVDTPTEWQRNRHVEHELLWTGRGAAMVEIGSRFWLVPPSVGIVIPADTDHVVRCGVATDVYATFMDPTLVHWDSITAVAMSTALRELLLHQMDTEMDTAARLRMQRVTMDMMVRIEDTSLTIPMPTSPHLRSIAQAIVENPSDNRSVTEWARRASISDRTLTRAFTRETGMSLTQWRIHVRVRSALMQIADGRSIRSVASNVGYSNPGTFIDLFRDVTGHTPAAYFSSFRGRVQKPE